MSYHLRSKSDIRVIKAILKNRTRIINDCIELIETSKNIEIVVRRKNIAIENIDWFIEAERIDSAIKSNPPPHIFRDQLLRLFNECLLELIQNKVEDKIKKFKIRKSGQAKQKILDDAIDIIYSNIGYFEIEDSSYSAIIEPKISALYSNIELLQ